MDNTGKADQACGAAAVEALLPKEASEALSRNGNAKLLDVRSYEEFEEAHIKDSVNIPLDSLSSKLGQIGGNESDYILICRSGKRAAMAAEILVKNGFRSVKVLSGGVMQWEKEGLPLIKGRKVISIVRQVMIIAGSLILSGIILGIFVSPWFIAVSAFVSCGLIYSGITNNCMMAMLLMKLPYNKDIYKGSSGLTCSVK